ncbi:MAG: PRC-barrel domain-containing protein [Actinobacteria bacterium]|nr:PRC-barrel domain-containing protein [Actinomycetota bacterium]
MEERRLVGLEARSVDGVVLGRISDILTDDESGEATHVIVTNDEEEQLELPISALSLDPEADFARFHADPSDEEPGDHLGDTEEPQGYAPAQSDVPNDYEHEGQFVTTPTDPDEAQSPEELERQADEAGGYEDESSTTVDSGYPRNDVYIDPDTGVTEPDPAMEDNETLEDDVQSLINGTALEVRAAKEGVVELSGSAATREDLDEAVREIMGLDGVLDVDTTDVAIG